MDCKTSFLLAVFFAQSVVGSVYHGPVAIPHVLKSGYLADTHEVSAAKDVHLAALAKESHDHGYGGDHDHSYGHGQVIKYHGPTAIPHVLKSGYLADTHEVAAAKDVHLAALAKESHDHGYGADHDHSYGHDQVIKYHGPTAIPHVLKSGYLADTHEVAAAKDVHLATLAKESHDHGYGAKHRGSYGADHDHFTVNGQEIKYHGPTAIPHVLKSGYLRDTLEVAAAKDLHLAALTKESHDNGYGGDHDHSYGHGHDIKYHGPTAVPHVLKSGYLADTHEVAAAKADHYAAVAQANTHGDHGYEGDYEHSQGEFSGHGYSHRSYQGSLAATVVLPSGYLADTHEVHAVRHLHIQALHSEHH